MPDSDYIFDRDDPLDSIETAELVVNGITDGGGREFDGRIDDARLYSKELTSTEVSNLYNNGRI